MCSSVDTHHPPFQCAQLWGVSARSVTASIYRTTKLAVEIRVATGHCWPTTSNAGWEHYYTNYSTRLIISHIKHTVVQYHNHVRSLRFQPPVVAPKRRHV